MNILTKTRPAMVWRLTNQELCDLLEMPGVPNALLRAVEHEADLRHLLEEPSDA